MNELKKCINDYKVATKKLATFITKFRQKHPKQRLLELTLLDKTKLEALHWIGQFNYNIPDDILPEHILELRAANPKQYKELMNAVESDRLRPSQLRVLIRSKQQVIKSKDKKVKISSWNKHLMMLEREIKNMTPEVKARALSQLTNTILS